MFEGDLDALDDTAFWTAVSSFRVTRDRADVRILQAALGVADRNHEPHRGDAAGDAGAVLPGMERIRVYGGDGCPGVAEFAPVELGAVLGISSGAAADLIGDALGLRHRLPRLWARVLAGQAQAWRARRIATACLTLSREAAALVDARVAPIVNSVGPRRLKKIVTAAVWDADPDQARAAAEESARARGVWIGESDDHGTKTIFVRAAAGDVIHFDATVDALADALKELGDTDTKERRRAKVIGWIADPDCAIELRDAAWQLARDRMAQPTGDAQPTADAGRTEGAGSVPGEVPDGAAADGHGFSADDLDEPPEPPEWDEEPEPPEGDREPDEPVDLGVVLDFAGPDDRAHSNHDSIPDDSDLGDGADPDRSHTETDSAADADDGGELAVRLAEIKHRARAARTRTGNTRAGSGGGRSRGSAPPTVYVHLTDLTLATGDGVVRVDGIGPMLASQVGELVGYDKIVVKPVIDLRDQVSVDAYEIADRIRELVLLRYLVCGFPWCNRLATAGIDLDHIVPYDDTGPPGQTSTTNLGPRCRLHHRVKTHGGWICDRLCDGTEEWTSPRGFRYRVDQTGTHRIDDQGAAGTADTVGDTDTTGTTGNAA